MAMVIRLVYPRCKSPKYKKSGHLHNGKQNHRCKDCDRPFVDCFELDLVSDTRVASLHACYSNVCPYGRFAGRWGWDSSRAWA